jgi:two-component sensor histidine kinase
MSLIAQLILPEYREQMNRRGIKAHKERKSLDTEIKLRHARTGEIRWHRLITMPRKLSNGTYVWDGVQYDITDNKRAEEHLRLMVNELNHRVKNTLATVQSLAIQSFHRVGLATSDDICAARTAFEARLFALSRAHDVLTRENWEGANLSDVVREACAPFRTHVEDAGRIEAQGQELRVPPAMSLSLSMAIHELCTNALKYGALKTSAGGVRISWFTTGSDDGARLVFRWEEHGGPPVSPPLRTGFGSRLIQKGLARELNGSAHIAYEPAGVICIIDVPLEVPFS